MKLFSFFQKKSHYVAARASNTHFGEQTLNCVFNPVKHTELFCAQLTLLYQPVQCWGLLS